jgi:general secretion pathway protein J
MRLPTQRSGTRRLSHNAGMTLIEILVAVSLLGLLSVGIVTSLEVGANSWQRARTSLTLDRRIATANAILHSGISGIAPVLAEVPPDRHTGLQNLIFFQGEPQSMRFVSSYSVTEGRRGGLQIVELQIVDSERGRRVLLNQMPYRGPLSVGMLVAGFVRDENFPRGRVIFQPIQPRATSLIILDELQDCQFVYLKPPGQYMGPSVWIDYWDETYMLPVAVAIRLTPQGGSERLLPVSIVAAIPAQGAFR